MIGGGGGKVSADWSRAAHGARRTHMQAVFMERKS